jgi:L-threonylcarbamoyladenylate synthase
MLRLHVTDNEAITVTAATLHEGGVVVVPTDTVYGLAAVPHDPDAVGRIFLAKARPADTHLPVLAASLDQVAGLGVEFSEAARALAARWWPGPLTLAFGFSDTRARPAWLEGRTEVAVRIPAHRFLLDVMAETGVLLVTSANAHGQATAPSAAEAAEALAPHVALIVDGGVLASTPSTLINVAVDPPVVERQGAIESNAVADVLSALT